MSAANTRRRRCATTVNVNAASPNAAPASATLANRSHCSGTCARSGVGVCSTPSARTTRSPITEATNAGSTARLRLRPLRWTSRPNTAPASGTPNTAPNPPDIAAISSVRRSSCSRRMTRAAASVRLPLIWIAVPSRPADPPKRCVTTVPMKTSGAILRGTQAVGSWISSMISVLPSTARPPP